MSQKSNVSLPNAPTNIKISDATANTNYDMDPSPSPIYTYDEQKINRSVSSPVMTFSDVNPLSFETHPLIHSPPQRHECDTINDEILMEEIKDLQLIEKYKHNNIQFTELENAVYKAFNCIGWQYKDLQMRMSRLINDLCDQEGINRRQIPESPIKLNICKDFPDTNHFKLDRSKSLNTIPSNCNEIKSVFTAKMNPLLPLNPTKQIKEQCVTQNCSIIINGNEDILSQCPCIQRICVFLEIYHKFHDMLNSSITVKMIDYLQIDNKYDMDSLNEDFLHIHTVHMSQNSELQKLICAQIKNKFPCNSKMCFIDQRRKQNRKHNTNIDKDSLFSVTLNQLCDKIHSYFLHSNMQYGCDSNTDKEHKNDQKNADEDDPDDFIGNEEDKKWLKTIEYINIKHEQQIYENLICNMGVFRWQSAHGLNSKLVQDLTHLKPRHKNVKEEVLQNSFCKLPIESWNLTVAKVHQFKNSFAAERMRTTVNGKYNDQIMGLKAEWKGGEIPTMKEITVIKLYTDWDELQAELKKCFRLESVDDIVHSYSPNAVIKQPSLTIDECASDSETPQPGNTQQMFLDPLRVSSLKPEASLLTPELSTLSSSVSGKLSRTHSTEQDAINKLKDRLCEFFHWRGNLLIFINKFSQIIEPTLNDKEFVLYHGVNNRMILNPSLAQSFYGPLSTTSSYYVAQNFATDKGMILAVSSKYPRLKMCNAFDASVISDYPEEQEFLIGHIYLRIRKVYAKSFKTVEIHSKLRYAFFALHLFREQMFAINEGLEQHIIPFIQIYLKDVKCIDEPWLKEILKQNEKDKNYISEYYKYLQKILKWGKKDKFKSGTPNTPPQVMKMSHDINAGKKKRIFYILIKKFKEFVTEPNLKQIVKLDCISRGLRPYFLKKTNKVIQNKEILYEISFKKVIALFPNTEQIQFLNWYKLDNNVLKKLITQIKRKDNKLKSVKFLYYDYVDPLEKHPFFFDDKKLDKTLVNKLDKLNWIIFSKLDKPGYSIKLKQK